MRWAKDRRALAGGVAACLLVGVVPFVAGDGIDTTAIDLLDGSAWLSSESDDLLVRVNGPTQTVDAVMEELGSLAGEVEVHQAGEVVLVEVDGQVRQLDVANLAWGATIDADGDLVVGPDATYLVTPDGVVRHLDPATLETLGQVDLGSAPGRGVVVDDRLVVPVDDGTIRIVDGERQVGSVDVGGRGDVVHVAAIGKGIVALNQSAARVIEIDPRRARVTGRASVELPEGVLQVPSQLPEGPLWVVALQTGELIRVNPRTGDSDTVPAATPGGELIGPESVGSRVYLVDRTSGTLVEVDAGSLEVRQEPLGISDASQVELVVRGEYAFVNDPTGQYVLVVDQDGETHRVDKHQTDGAAGGAPRNGGNGHADDGGTDDESGGDDEGGQDGAGPPPAEQAGDGPAAPADPGAPGTTVPEPTYDVPSGLSGLTVGSGDGTVGLSWDASTSETPITYVVGINPAVDGVSELETEATDQAFTGLVNGTTYTVTVTPTNDQGAGGSQNATATPGRGPQVSTVTPTRTGDRRFRVNFTFDAGGLALTTCQVTRSGGGSAVAASCDADGTGSATVDVPTYWTNYAFTVQVANSRGNGSAASSAQRSAAKPYTVRSDSAAFDGTCTWADWGGGTPNTRPYWTSPSHTCPAESPGPAGYVGLGSSQRGECYVTGERVEDDNLVGTTTWIRITGRGYMPTIYFTNYQSSPTANLPRC